MATMADRSSRVPLAALLTAAAAALFAIVGAGLEPGERPEAAIDESVDEQIDLGGLACLHVGARVALPDPMEIAVKRASLGPAPCTGH